MPVQTLPLRAGVAALAIASALAGLPAKADWPVSFTLASPAFEREGEIPRRHTCEGRNVSPPLTWSDVPEGTRSFALIVEDPDPPPPMAPRMTWVHWLLYNLPGEARSLPENFTRDLLPPQTGEGWNGWRMIGYGGPCPPLVEHRYVYTLYALRTVLPLFGTPTRAKLKQAMRGHILGRAELVGSYWRRER